jgi:hypothetical protein
MDDVKLLNLTGLKEGRPKPKGSRPRTGGERERPKDLRPSTVSGDMRIKTVDMTVATGAITSGEYKSSDPRLLASPIKVPPGVSALSMGKSHSKHTDVYIPIKVKPRSLLREGSLGSLGGADGSKDVFSDDGAGIGQGSYYAGDDNDNDQRPISLPLVAGASGKPLPRNAFEKKRSRHPKFKKTPPVAWPEENFATTQIYVPEAVSALGQAQAQGQDQGPGRGLNEDFLHKSVDAHSKLDEQGRQGQGKHKKNRAWGSGGGGRKRTALEEEQRKMSRSENLERLKLLANAESIIGQMPLAYLASKPELRHFAVERACRILVRPAVTSLALVLRKAFKQWHKPAIVIMNDTQVGFMVIAKCLEKLLLTAQRRKFLKWAYAFSRYLTTARELRSIATALTYPYPCISPFPHSSPLFSSLISSFLLPACPLLFSADMTKIDLSCTETPCYASSGGIAM